MKLKDMLKNSKRKFEVPEQSDSEQSSLANSSIISKFMLFFFFFTLAGIISLMTFLFYVLKFNMIDKHYNNLKDLSSAYDKKIVSSINNIENSFFKPLANAIKNNTMQGLEMEYLAFGSLPSNLINACYDSVYKNIKNSKMNTEILSRLGLVIENAIPTRNSGIIANCIHQLTYKTTEDEFLNFKERQSLLNNLNIQHFLSASSQIQAFLKKEADINEVYNKAFIISAKDDIILSAGEDAPIGHNLKDSLWLKNFATAFYKLKENFLKKPDERFFYIDMMPYFPQGGIPNFFIVMPIFQRNNYSGSIVLPIDSIFLDDKLELSSTTLNINNISDIFIANEETHKMVSNSKKFIENPNYYYELFKKNGLEEAYRLSVASKGVAYWNENFMLLSNPKEDIFSSRYGFITHEEKDHVYITYYSPISISKGVKWSLFLTVDQDILYSDIKNTRFAIIIISISVALFLFFISIFFLRIAVKPILLFKEELKRRNLSNLQPIKLKQTYFEVDELVSTFNNLLENLSLHEKEVLNNSKSLTKLLERNTLMQKELLLEKDVANKMLNAEGFFIIVFDENNRVVRSNRAVYDIFSYSNIIGIHYKDIFPKEHAFEIYNVFSLLRENRQNYSESEKNISRVVDTSIEDRHIEWRFSIAQDIIRKEYNFIIAVGIDVTEHFYYEKDMRTKDTLGKNIFDFVREGVILTNTSNEIMLVNPAATALLGYSATDLLGESIIPKVFLKEYESVQLLTYDENITLEMEATKKDGSKILTEVSIIRSNYENSDSIIYNIRDLSSIKRLETELRDSNIKILSMQKDFVNLIMGFADELKAPIHSIDDFLKILQGTELNISQKEYLNILSNITSYLSNTVSNMLEYSNITENLRNEEIKPFSLWELIDDTVSFFTPTSSAKGITLLSSFNIKLPYYVSGNYRQLRLALVNILENAIISVPNSKYIVVRVISLAESDSNLKARISISSNEVLKDEPLLAAVQEDIYDGASYSLEEEVSVEEKKHEPIWLTLTKEFLKSIKSSIQFYSEEKKGSELSFTLNLPIVKPEEIDSEMPALDIPDFSDFTYALYLPKEEYENADGNIFSTYFMNLNSKLIYLTEDNLVENLNNFNAMILPAVYFNVPELGDIVRSVQKKKVLVLANTHDETQISTMVPDYIFIAFKPFTMRKIVDITKLIIEGKPLRYSSNKSAKKEQFKGNVLLIDKKEQSNKFTSTFLEAFGLDIVSVMNLDLALEKMLTYRFDMIFYDISNIESGNDIKKIIDFEYHKSLSRTPLIVTTEMDESSYEYGNLFKDIATHINGIVVKPLTKQKLLEILENYLEKAE